MKIIYLLLLLSSVIAARKELTIVDELRQELYKLDGDLDKELESPRWKDVELKKIFKEIIREYRDFGDRIDQLLPGNTSHVASSIQGLWVQARAQSEMKNVLGLYTMFRRMQSRILDGNSDVNVALWISFADTILKDPNAAIPANLARIQDLIIEEKLFVLAYQKAANEICYEQQSPQQLLYSLYNSVALAEVKGYVMMQFSWKLKKYYGDGNYVNEMRQVLRDYQHRTSMAMREIKTAMSFAPRDLWKCDPTIHREDVTFSQLKHVFQGYIVNEVDMNDKNTCRENCAYYNYAKVYGCFKNQYCGQQRTCNGKIVGCQYIDSDMWICPAEQNSNRRYEYIEYENGQVFGEKGTCTRGTTKVDSWWRWLFWHCSYCFCYCDENTDDSERHWNLREVVSDVSNNKVITGLRLRKVNKIVHVQIQEGVLLPQGKIDQSTIKWKPIENYTILDSHVNKGIDYHTFDWNKRAVDLDDLRLPNTAVLTGIKFKLIGTRLNLEIQGTPFNFTSGKLLREKVQWHSNDNTERTELKIEKPDIPTKLDLASEPDTKMNQYLNFAPTDLQKDAAQSTIPFLDIQDVVSVPPIPFGGAGIFHKGRTESGGFLTMKLLTYDFTPHLHVDLPPPPSLLESRDNEVHVN